MLKQLKVEIKLANPKPVVVSDIEKLIKKAKTEVKNVKELMNKANSGDISNADLNKMGIKETFTATELKQINELIDDAEPKPVTTKEIELLIDEATGKAKALVEVLEKIEDDNITNEDIAETGINVVLSEEELKELNELIKDGFKPETVNELRNIITKAIDLVDEVKSIVEKAPNITNEDLRKAGVEPNNLTKSQLAYLNNLIKNAKEKPITLKDIESLIDVEAPEVAKDINITQESDGKIVISGKAEAGSKVIVTLPSGEIKEIFANSDGSFNITSDDVENSGTVKVKVVDAAGNVSEEKEIVFSSWYKVVKDENKATVIEYVGEKYEDSVKDGENSASKTIKSTKIIINPTLIVEHKEIAKDQVELDIKAPTGNKAPEVVLKKAPKECEGKDYIAYIKLYKDSGEVETGFSFGDPGCISKVGRDSTIYDNKPLKFVPGTEVKIENTPKKGGKVIIIDAVVDRIIKFGER